MQKDEFNGSHLMESPFKIPVSSCACHIQSQILLVGRHCHSPVQVELGGQQDSAHTAVSEN